ncbi:MAG TPA: glycosyltransferase family 9 protein, partial [Acidimicrobiia bacterium]|nr:glycosyltransferase family 9 protein [Acidimicrobiia bacterium]
MRVERMRLVDRLLGVPACAVLTVARRLGDLVRRRPVRTPRRIAFVKLAEQGSTVIASSALRRAIRMVGRENVFFVVFEENRFILDVMGLLPGENVVAIRADGLLGLLAGTLSALRRLRRLRVDAVVDLEFFARFSAILAYLSGASSRVGFHPFGGGGPYRGDLMTHRLLFNPHLHTAQTFEVMVEALEIPPHRLPTFDRPPPPADDPPPAFVPEPHEIESVRLLLRDAGGAADEPIVLLNPNCSDLLPLRAWPSGRYVELARRLLDHDPRVRVVMTGAPSEQDEVAALVRAVGSDRCASLAGRTTLRELLVLYALAEVLVTNDSGPAHFATLTPIDVVTLFGP